MKALSIRQPWAWLIVNGYKDIENRVWNTKFRGKVLIHASLKLDSKAYDDVLKAGYPIPSKSDIARGGIVGEAILLHVVTESNNPWFHGPYGLVMDRAKILPFVPAKGQLRFFEFDYENEYKSYMTKAWCDNFGRTKEEFESRIMGKWEKYD